jgi:hypothetical protein
VSILINVSENLEHAEVLETHELLLERFNFSDGLNFTLANSNHTVLYIVTDFGQTIV